MSKLVAFVAAMVFVAAAVLVATKSLEVTLVFVVAIALGPFVGLLLAALVRSFMEESWIIFALCTVTLTALGILIYGTTT